MVKYSVCICALFLASSPVKAQDALYFGTVGARLSYNSDLGFGVGGYFSGWATIVGVTIGATYYQRGIRAHIGPQVAVGIPVGFGFGGYVQTGHGKSATNDAKTVAGYYYDVWGVLPVPLNDPSDTPRGAIMPDLSGPYLGLGLSLRQYKAPDTSIFKSPIDVTLFLPYTSLLVE